MHSLPWALGHQHICLFAEIQSLAILPTWYLNLGAHAPNLKIIPQTAIQVP